MTNRPKYSLNNAMIIINSRTALICMGLLISSLLIACASTPPSKTLPQSKVAVSSVDHTNYRKHLSSDVDAVKAKLKQAQSLEADKQHSQLNN